MAFEQEIELAKKLSLEAGKVIMGFYGTDVTVEEKENNTPLTQADTAANALIVSGLKDVFPDDFILSEEEKDTKNRLNESRLWIVDPLDGTKEFIKNDKDFTVNIALVVDKKPVLGVVYLPARKVLYYGVVDEGAYKQEEQGELQKIVPAQTAELSSAKYVGSKSHTSKQLLDFFESHSISNFVLCGSSLKGCYVADATADAYVRFGPQSEWDICAMNAVLHAAGAKMTQLNGEPITYNNKDILVRGFVAANKELHENLINEINK